MVMPPPRASSHSYRLPRSSHKVLTCLAFLIFSAFFIFKVDILIFRAISASRRNQLEIVTTDRAKLTSHNGTFHRHFLHSWGENRAHILEDGELVSLSLDEISGAGFESRRTFLFAKIDMQIKLIPGNSAGTVTTYYLSSEGNRHDEIDFEFLGNSTGNPYTLHTNVFCRGKGEREQQFFLWFDPTQDFHTYTILWNPKNIIFFVDDVPIRQFRNIQRHHVPFPQDQPMRLYSSLWNADEWATQGGRVKTDWSAAPFVASYRNFSVDGCIKSYRAKSSSCTAEDFQMNPVLRMELDGKNWMRLKKVQREHMVYDYCSDRWRFPKGPAPECRYN